MCPPQNTSGCKTSVYRKYEHVLFQETCQLGPVFCASVFAISLVGSLMPMLTTFCAQ